MKKFKILVCLVAVVLIVTGCEKDKKEEKEVLSGGWHINMDAELVSGVSKNASNAFEKAYKAYKGNKLEPIALLGSQVVAGTKYMFLCKDTTDEDWKIVVVSVDLEGNTKITDVNTFDYVKYVSKDITIDNDDTVVGGFIVYDGMGEAKLPDEIGFSLIQGVDGVSYRPIAYLGSQVVAGQNFAVLAFSKTTTKDSYPILSVLTIYKDLDNNSKITSVAQVKLADLVK